MLGIQLAGAHRCARAQTLLLLTRAHPAPVASSSSTWTACKGALQLRSLCTAHRLLRQDLIRAWQAVLGVLRLVCPIHTPSQARSLSADSQLFIQNVHRHNAVLSSHHAPHHQRIRSAPGGRTPPACSCPSGCARWRGAPSMCHLPDHRVHCETLSVGSLIVGWPFPAFADRAAVVSSKKHSRRAVLKCVRAKCCAPPLPDCVMACWLGIHLVGRSQHASTLHAEPGRQGQGRVQGR